MKCKLAGSFLCGFAFGAGVTVFALYSRKPRGIAASLETIAAIGRTRRAEEEEARVRRERLREAGFSDEEIDEVFQ